MFLDWKNPHCENDSTSSFEQEDGFCFPDTTSIIVSIDLLTHACQDERTTPLKKAAWGWCRRLFLRVSPFVSYRVASSCSLML